MKKKNENNKVLYDLDYSCAVIPRSLGLPDSIAYGPGMMRQHGRSAPPSSCSYLLRESIDWIPGTSPRMTLYGEVGRSMVETLATLAIMGILTVAGVAAYNSAMNRYRANTLINEAQKRAVIVAGQIGFNNQKPNLSEFEPYNKTSAGEFKEVTTGGLYKQFGIKVSGVTKPVCQNILNTLGEATPIRRLSKAGTPTTPIIVCKDTNDFLIIYNDDMQGATSDTEYAIDDSSCKSVCGTFNPETHLCNESDCEIPTNTCTVDTDCNTNNECIVCDTTAGLCKNGCERVEYLESTGPRITLDVTGCLKSEFKVQLLPDSKRTVIGYDSWKWWGKTTNNTYEFNGDSSLLVGNRDIINYNLIPNGNSVKNEFYLNNSFISSRSIVTSCPNQFFKLFNIGSFDSHTKIYYAKFYELNNTLVRDFVPVITPASSKGGGKPCMFDKVSQKLFCNVGSGTFKTNKDN